VAVGLVRDEGAGEVGEKNELARFGLRRRLSRSEMDALANYIGELPEQLAVNLYSGLGGQPSRMADKTRMVQLTVRALAQGSRLGTLIKSLHQRDRQALAILVQCGGLGHSTEFIQELVLSLGGNEREWTKVMALLSGKGLVGATEVREGLFFYMIPDPILEHLLPHLHEDLVLPTFDDEDVRVLDERPFCPPIDFSVVTLASYIDQRPPRLTQGHELFKTHKEEMDTFFEQLWEPDSELFSFHIEFLMIQGLVELRGDRLAVNRGVVEEWLHLDPEDRRDLIFSSLERRFAHAEWVLWAIKDVGEDWVPDRPLHALYRRWVRGEDWRARLHKDTWQTARTAERDSYSFAPLVNTGMLELGQWGQEKFYRLSPRARHMLEPQEAEEFSQFYLTPSFEIMAPAGMSPILFFRIGELAELTACDRANTYKISEVRIEQALEKGWRRDDILEFLSENSQIGLPENVDQTLRGWMGHHGDVEFHDLTLMTVHRSQIKRLETHRKLKPFLIHRFVPGMYAVDRSRLEELNAALEEAGFTPNTDHRKYPDDPQQVGARERLLSLVVQAREDREDTLAIAHAADTRPGALHIVPGSVSGGKRKRKKNELPPRCSPREVREICERACSQKQNLQMLYVARDGQRKLVRVAPERVAVNHAGQQVLVAEDLSRKERLAYQLIQIERLAAYAPKR
jgi:signal recognition particle subunit SEC65